MTTKDFKVDAHTSENYSRTERVTVTVGERESGFRFLEVTVGHSTSSSSRPIGAPRLCVDNDRAGFSREEWETIKRMGDHAWNEYGCRFPVSK